MKNYGAKKLAVTLLCIMMVLGNIMTVSAAKGTTMIMMSTTDIKTGESVDVTVSASTAGDVTIKYTPALLEATDCNVAGYTSNTGSLSFSGKSGTITFKSLAAGTASIMVESNTCTGSSAFINITDAATTEATDTVATSTAAPLDLAAGSASAYDGLLTAEGKIDMNGTTYLISERYKENEVPSGFTTKNIPIGSKNYKEVSNGTVTLMYLKPESNTQGSGEWYVYDAAAGSVTKFNYVGTEKNFILVANPPEALNDEMESTSITSSNGGEVAAYTFGGDYYYIYGTDMTGVTGWFCYDAGTKTYISADTYAIEKIGASEPAVQQPVTTIIESESTVDEEDYARALRKADMYFLICMVVGILCVVLIIVITVMAVKGGKEDDIVFSGNNNEVKQKSFFDEKDPIKPASKRKNKPKKDFWTEKEDAEEREMTEDDEEAEAVRKIANVHHRAASIPTNKSQTVAKAPAAEEAPVRAQQPVQKAQQPVQQPAQPVQQNIEPYQQVLMQATAAAQQQANQQAMADAARRAMVNSPEAQQAAQQAAYMQMQQAQMQQMQQVAPNQTGNLNIIDFDNN